MDFEPFGSFGRKWPTKAKYEVEKRFWANRHRLDYGLAMKAAEQRWVGEQREMAKTLARNALAAETARKKALANSAKSKNRLRRKRLRKGLHLL